MLTVNDTHVHTGQDALTEWEVTNRDNYCDLWREKWGVEPADDDSFFCALSQSAEVTPDMTVVTDIGDFKRIALATFTKPLFVDNLNVVIVFVYLL
jgi:hypothetical protein